MNSINPDYPRPLSDPGLNRAEPVCRSKTSGKSPKAPTRKIKWLTTSDSADSDSASDCPPDNSTENEPQPLFVVSDRSSPPYKVKLEVNGQALEMEEDTGAAVSLAPESAVATLLPIYHYTTAQQCRFENLHGRTDSG